MTNEELQEKMASDADTILGMLQFLSDNPYQAIATLGMAITDMFQNVFDDSPKEVRVEAVMGFVHVLTSSLDVNHTHTHETVQ